MYCYGWCHLEGVGCIKNEKEGFKLMEIASKLGNISGKWNYYKNIIHINNYIINYEYIICYFLAINHVGYCYQNGKGCLKDLNKAFELYEKAANLGNSAGIYNIIYSIFQLFYIIYYYILE